MTRCTSTCRACVWTAVRATSDVAGATSRRRRPHSSKTSTRTVMTSATPTHWGMKRILPTCSRTKVRLKLNLKFEISRLFANFLKSFLGFWGFFLDKLFLFIYFLFFGFFCNFLYLFYFCFFSFFFVFFCFFFFKKLILIKFLKK